MSHILLIDNYDSFTYNLVQAFRELGAMVTVTRNDTATFEDLMSHQPTHLVVSPGPGTPREAGGCISFIQKALGQLPILGICLGHQCLVEALGGRVVRATKGIHGKTSVIDHHQQELFQDAPHPLEVGRYHSLIAQRDALPTELTVTASTSSGEIMAVAHRRFNASGFQFHPESILTPNGPQLLQNFLHQTGGLR